MHILTHTHTNTYTHVHTHACTYAHVPCMHASTHICTRTHTAKFQVVVKSQVRSTLGLKFIATVYETSIISKQQ